MIFLTALVCFIAGIMFCEGSPVAPVARDLDHSPLTTAHSTSGFTISGSHTSHSISTVYHSCKSHGKTSHPGCEKPKPTTAHEVLSSLSSALINQQVTTVTIARTVHAPHSTRSTHPSHKASSPHKSHSINSTHGSHSAHTTHSHQTGSSVHTIKVTQTVTYQISSHSHVMPSATTTKAGVATSFHTSSVNLLYSSTTSHNTVSSHSSSSPSSSSTSKTSTPVYTITPVLLPSGHISSSKGSTLLTTKIIQSSASSFEITTHLKSAIRITSVITVAPSSTHTSSNSATNPTHPIVLARAVNKS
ncbi:hypothetical protein BKA65DRAFT_497732 [Rhexocercosporidium sp. MPI-PUGE-AT-0058]|nr:hypothetical protein BKA65DRAFT_497732 [Rhexocercosporidium sp. MPI-PUGE-AT-0058]